MKVQFLQSIIKISILTLDPLYPSVTLRGWRLMQAGHNWSIIGFLNNLPPAFSFGSSFLTRNFVSLNVKGCGLLFSVYIWICKYESSLLYMHTCIRDLTDIEIQFCHRRRRGRSPPTRSEYRLAVTNLSTRCSWQVRLTYMIKAAALEWLMAEVIITQFIHSL